MARRHPAYVESWDRGRFSDPQFQQRGGRREWLDAEGLLPASYVKWKKPERVIATGEGDVLKGHVVIAEAIVESWCADNPVVFIAIVTGWISQAKAADDADKDWHRRWEDRLNFSPHLVQALEKGPGEVFRLANLTPFQARAVELMLDGRTKTEIGAALNISRQAATERLEAALEKVMALDREEVA